LHLPLLHVTDPSGTKICIFVKGISGVFVGGRAGLVLTTSTVIATNYTTREILELRSQIKYYVLNPLFCDGRLIILTRSDCMVYMTRN